MITLVTGTPGAGKTLWAVKHIIEELLPTGRAVYTNINGLCIDAPNIHVCDDKAPFEWSDYPDGSIFVFDEVQRQYPPRHSTSKTPKYISDYQTHRHRAMDFVFISQGPKLIDRHLWDLTERHVHLFRVFGLERSKIREWGSVNDTPQPPQSETSAMKQTFKFPKKYFDNYKSAVGHTVKVSLPWHIIVPTALGGLVVASLIGFVAYRVTRPPEVLSSLSTDVLEPVTVNRCPFNVVGSTKTTVIVSDGINTASVNKALVKQTESGVAFFSADKECFL